ncbi:hypothetical protein EX30DRAFT_349855 [Ascodesmis nigricans]|uniref:Uncharacterized protein n=1 Tax=Ascodesmis nigricans TaxID=341454 RepID=A0A4S2MTS9_9PEZI|nr:hypothetical protein EX30DRAFT_349855 [Ascodesmis nigricans]
MSPQHQHNESFTSGTPYLEAKCLNVAYQLSAKVKISAIDLKYPSRAVDENNIRRLRDLFKTEGCRYSEPLHRVPVLVEWESLKASAVEAGIDQIQSEAFNPFAHLSSSTPLLRFPEESLRCLHGHHRLWAALDYFPQYDQYWVVDIISKPPGVNDPQFDDILINYFGSTFINSQNMTDGEILRHILLTEGQPGSGRCWARLTRTKMIELRQMLRSEPFRCVLTRLVPIPGLWVGIQLGNLT